MTDIETGRKITDSEIIANYLNSFFCSIGEKLYRATKDPSVDFNPPIIPNIERSFFLSQTTSTEISRIIGSLKASRSNMDCINSCLLKNNQALFVPKLVEIINEHLCACEFPPEQKTARIVPILKNGSPVDPSNYRPISILPTLAKVYETLLYDRIDAYLTKNKVINKNQFGFLKNSGTLAASSVVMNYIQTNLDGASNNIIGATFIDLKKAFDTVPHAPLLKKTGKVWHQGAHS